MIELTVNGQARKFDGDGDVPLLWYLRDELDLTGAKFGCGMGLCGACTVHLNGEAIRSCVTPLKAAAGKRITTIEGLSANGTHPCQARLGETQRGAVRILPERPDHAGRRAAAEDAQAHRCPDR